MIKRRKIQAAFSLVLPLLLLCGCNAPVESFLSPPKLSDEQSAIYEALKNGKGGGDIHLKYPKSGKYRSAFVVENIDGEESDEAIVFYEASNVSDTGSSLRLNFLDRDDGKWVSVYDLAALGSEIERVQFADLGDGETSIIITYTIQNSSDSAISVLKYSDKTPVEVFAGRCAYMQILDVNEDGHDELLQISRDFDGGGATASILAWSDPLSFRVMSAAPVSGFAECKGVTLGVGTEGGQKAIFVDRSISDGSIGTDALLISGTSLSASEATAQIVRRTNSFTPDMNCRDIDDDGIIEIPATTVLPGYESLSRPEQVSLTSWYMLENRGRAIKRKYLTYMSIRCDYLLLIPPRWEGLVTANVSISEGRITFSEYNAAEHSAGDELLTIRAVSSSAAAPEGFVLIGECEATGYSFYVRNNVSNSLALTDAELSDHFKVIQ